MSQKRLHQIAFLFPNGDVASRDCFAALTELFRHVPGVMIDDDHIVLTPQRPVGALPATHLRLAPVPVPQITFEPALRLDLDLGGLRLGTGTAGISGPLSQAPMQAHLSMQQVAERLGSHIVGVDHTGVNLPSVLVSRPQWDALVNEVAMNAALYRYPSEDWPFIIPSSDDEFADDIGQFVPGRKPKFEWVYDTWTPIPAIQFSVNVDLPRHEIEALFPEPEGFGIPGLEQIFRSVYIAHPWPHLMIRLDLNYQAGAGNEVASDWDTGQWLVTQGGRIHGM